MPTTRAREAAGVIETDKRDITRALSRVFVGMNTLDSLLTRANHGLAPDVRRGAMGTVLAIAEFAPTLLERCRITRQVSVSGRKGPDPNPQHRARSNPQQLHRALRGFGVDHLRGRRRTQRPGRREGEDPDSRTVRLPPPRC